MEELHAPELTGPDVALHYLVAIEESTLVAPLFLDKPPAHVASLYERMFGCPRRGGSNDAA
jgi:hypothetical protein